MPCKCVECGGKIDCDSIICGDCLVEIINKVNLKDQGNSGDVKSRDKIEVIYG
jgi:hypothetical protein